MSHDMRFPTMLYVRPAKPQIRLRVEFLSLKGGSTFSSESTLVKMPHCWKSHVVAQIWKKLFKTSANNECILICQNLPYKIFSYGVLGKSNVKF